MNIPPFNIIDNIYYVGTDFVSSHLFTSEKGHILIDTCLPGEGGLILKNIKTLGFNPGDIKRVFITHSHFDHIGGAAQIAKETGAEIFIGEQEINTAMHQKIIRYDKFGNKTEDDITGKVLSNKQKYFMNFEPVNKCVALKHNSVHQLGNIVLKAVHTPGHSAGAFSFAFQVINNGKSYNGFIPGGIGANVFSNTILEDNVFGANINDYIQTLEGLKKHEADIWLGAHPFFNRTFEKKDQSLKQNTNSFIEAASNCDNIDSLLSEAKEIKNRL